MGAGASEVSLPQARRLLFWRRCVSFCAVLAVTWLALYSIDRAFPLIRPGHELIYQLAKDTVRTGVVFPTDVTATRVAVFGDSRVQAGFVPALLDRLSGGATYSFNLGLPNDTRFLDELRTLVRRDQAPDVVALTLPWIARAEETPLLEDDVAFVEAVLPFRPLFRDGTLFVLRSLTRGGPRAYYVQARENVDRARRDRGYFFIEGMSHFPGHRLPDGFVLDGDDPDEPHPRRIPLEGPAFEEVLELRERAGFRVVFVPSYLRVGNRAPSSAPPELRSALGVYGIEVRGPDYWLYPNRLFSDPGHLNPEGAEHYTRELWELLAPTIPHHAS
jgi:hypothetical protein